jgi:methionine aminopeptidase
VTVLFYYKNDLVVELDTTCLSYIKNKMTKYKKTKSKKKITKTICDSVNHTRLPKEDHLPD